jgi:uncharacterized membrane protein
MKIIPAFLLVIGTALFFSGIHNIDNSYNMQSGMFDKSMLLQFDKGTLYEMGVFLAIAGFFLAIMSALLLFEKQQSKDEDEYKELI